MLLALPSEELPGTAVEIPFWVREIVGDKEN